MNNLKAISALCVGKKPPLFFLLLVGYSAGSSAFTCHDVTGNTLNSVIVSGAANVGNDSNLLIVFYVQIMPDDFVMQLHRF